MEFPAFVAERVAAALKTLGPPEARDTYVVSFFVNDHEDNPMWPTLTVGTNTESHAEERLRPSEDRRWGRPSDADEARWNYAFWLQNELVVVASPDVDPEGAGLCEQWIRANGLWVDEPTDWADPAEARRYVESAGRLTQAFVQLCVETARSLHESGLIVEVFGRSVPILVHELEYDDEIAEQAKRANPLGLADDFVAWIAALYE